MSGIRDDGKSQNCAWLLNIEGECCFRLHLSSCHVPVILNSKPKHRWGLICTFELGEQLEWLSELLSPSELKNASPVNWFVETSAMTLMAF